jgi:hypothetical protein
VWGNELSFVASRVAVENFMNQTLWVLASLALFLFIMSCVYKTKWKKEERERGKTKGELANPIKIPVLIHYGAGDVYSAWVYVARNGKVYAPQEAEERQLELQLMKSGDIDRCRQILGAPYWTRIDHPEKTQIVMLGRVFTASS